MRSSSWIGLLLVVGGALYLLSMFHVLNVPAGIWAWDSIWPLILVVLGLGGLRNFRRTIPWGALFLIGFGVFLFLRNSSLAPGLSDISVSGVFWALLFIYLGISFFAPKRFGGWKPKLVVDFGNNNGPSDWQQENEDEEYGSDESHGRGPQPPEPPRPPSPPHRVELGWREAFGDWKDWRPKAQSTRHWIGDISLGSEPWVLEDMSVWNGVGDVRINLATAHLEDRTYHIQVEGWVGDVRILVPSSLPVAVYADVSIGDVNVFEHAESGTSRMVQVSDPLFDSSVRRLKIGVRLKIGDVQIVRV